MRTRIEFGGFYESIHDQLLDSAVEMFCMNDDGNIDEGMLDDWDWCDSRYSYMLEWSDLFEMWLKDEYGLDINFTELKLWSPQFYNFRTDEIDATINLAEREANDLVVKFSMTDQAFDDYMRQATTSRDGFISFYDYDQARENKDGIGLQLVLRYLAEKFNDNDLIDYYDRNNSYERVA